MQILLCTLSPHPPPVQQKLLLIQSSLNFLSVEDFSLPRGHLEVPNGSLRSVSPSCTPHGNSCHVSNWIRRGKRGEPLNISLNNRMIVSYSSLFKPLVTLLCVRISYQSEVLLIRIKTVERCGMKRGGRTFPFLLKGSPSSCTSRFAI